MYAALLRGINVGGNRKVPMAELRELLGGLGHAAVRTHLNSGNAVFSSDTSDEDALAAELEEALEQRFGFHVACMVRGAEYLRDVRDACPFPTDPAHGVGGKELHVVFCSRSVPAERLASLDAAAYLPEEVRAGDRALYLYTPGGLGTSRLSPALHRPGVLGGVDATSRNWNTVTALVELTRD
ncbi:DUF1697 domain-containing protein [Streptomyces qinglanensis]|uniref:Uncharacterized conserved protein, DUF1697 family n=1 Tax=Streptomyces qinglanensis TaxID=943816 RepID=A0A1H9WGS4_9ACTN|nr:DUF1697 domain-containing protein [Streptomyces qinglanensis]SES32959.1 Uncharacterized conserved protein, DUF1697 family [Streptomyces qinglanensis]